MGLRKPASGFCFPPEAALRSGPLEPRGTPALHRGERQPPLTRTRVVDLGMLGSAVALDETLASLNDAAATSIEGVVPGVVP